jgi:hypothetical protein
LGGGKEDIDHPDDDYGGDKVGRIGNGLNYFFEPGVFATVQGQGEEYRQGKPGSQLVEAQGKGIPQNPAKGIKGKKTDKIFKAHPFAAQDPQFRTEVLKGDKDAVHGHIVENKKIDYRGEQKYIDLPVKEDPFLEAFLSPQCRKYSYRAVLFWHYTPPCFVLKLTPPGYFTINDA